MLLIQRLQALPRIIVPRVKEDNRLILPLSTPHLKLAKLVFVQEKLLVWRPSTAPMAGDNAELHGLGHGPLVRRLPVVQQL